MTNVTKTPAKYRVFTMNQGVTVPNFPPMEASRPLKRKDLWTKFVTFLSLQFFKTQKSDAWLSFY